jgi:hypothetical protein
MSEPTPPPLFQPPPEDPSDVPPHLARTDAQLRAVPRPIEAAAVHFRAEDRCYAAMVIDVQSEDPLSPDFTVDLVVFVPVRTLRKADRFTNLNRLPGSTRWANSVRHAVPDPMDAAKTWPGTTWHYPGRECLPEVVLRGAES